MRWMLVFVLSASGCDLFFDVSSVGYQAPVVEDMMSDMPEDMPDAESDLVEDMPDIIADVDMPEDMPEDIPVDLPDTFGQICEAGGLVFGNCDPIDQNCTNEGEACIQLFSAAQMTLVNACGPADAFVVEEGVACQAQDKCVPGLICRGTCKRMCDRSTGRGCNPDEFCRVFDASFGFGFCDVSC